MTLETDILSQITCTYLASKDPEGMLDIAKLVSTSVSKSGEDKAKTCAHIIKIFEGLVEAYKERVNE